MPGLYMPEDPATYITFRNRVRSILANGQHDFDELMQKPELVELVGSAETMALALERMCWEKIIEPLSKSAPATKRSYMLTMGKSALDVAEDMTREIREAVAGPDPEDPPDPAFPGPYEPVVTDVNRQYLRFQVAVLQRLVEYHGGPDTAVGKVLRDAADTLAHRGGLHITWGGSTKR